MFLTFDKLIKIKDETCFIVISKKDNFKYKQIAILKNNFKNIVYLYEEQIDNFIKEKIIENIIPSYIVVKNKNLTELGNIIY